MKDIIEKDIIHEGYTWRILYLDEHAYWHVHLRWELWNKTRKKRVSVKVIFSYVFSKLTKSFNVKTLPKQLLDSGKDPHSPCLYLYHYCGPLTTPAVLS